MNKTKYFENKIILITGGSSGIGYALAERIVGFHPKAVILLSNQESKLLSSVENLNKISKGVLIGSIVADIADSQSVLDGCAKVISDFGVPDIVINNAGYAHYYLFHEMSYEDIIRHVNVNLIGAMRIVHALLPSMRAAKSGQIVNVASIAGHMLILPNLVYSAAKHGMVVWSEGLALELADDNIFVQTISPGRVLTDFFQHKSFLDRTPGKEMSLTVSMEKVVDISINAIIKRKKLVIIPSSFRFVSWMLRAFPFFVKRLYFVLLKKRIARLR